MKTCLFLHAFLINFLHAVEGFALFPVPVLQNNRFHGRHDAIISSPTTRCLRHASPDSNQDEDNPTTTTAGDIDAYDFESGFQERLKKEGGRTGVNVKAAKRSVNSAVDSAARDVTGTVKSSLKKSGVGSDLGLLSNSEWSMTLGVLVLVVVLAVASHFAAPPPAFEALSTKDQLERLANAEQVQFGIR